MFVFFIYFKIDFICPWALKHGSSLSSLLYKVKRKKNKTEEIKVDLHLIGADIPQAVRSCQYEAVVQEDASTPEINLGETVVIKVPRIWSVFFVFLFSSFFREKVQITKASLCLMIK